MTFRTPDAVRFTASNNPNAATAFNIPASGDTGFRSLSQVFAAGQMADGDTVPYAAVAVDGDGIETGPWEHGIGTFNDDTTDTLIRTLILRSSNSDAAVDFSGATAVRIEVSAVQGVPLDGWEPYDEDVILSGASANAVSWVEKFSAGFDYLIRFRVDNKQSNTSYGFKAYLGYGATPTWHDSYTYAVVGRINGSSADTNTGNSARLALWYGTVRLACPVWGDIVLREMGDPALATVHAEIRAGGKFDHGSIISFAGGVSGVGAMAGDPTSFQFACDHASDIITDARFSVFRRRSSSLFPQLGVR